MENLMKKIFKKTLLIAMMASLVPMQSHGFYGDFKSTFASSFAWAKASCSSALASSYSSLKSCVVPALVGLGLLATAACTADYINNKQELDMFTSLKDQLQKQRADKKLSKIEVSNEQDKQLARSDFSELKKLIAAYKSTLTGVNVNHEVIIEKYEHLLAMEELQILQKTQQDLQKARKKLLDDPRLQSKISGEAQWMTLAQHLPDYTDITETFFSPKSQKFDATCSNEKRAQNVIDELEREILACETHINCPMYKNFKLDKMVNAHLNQLREHATAVKESTKKLKTTQAAIDRHEQQDNNKLQLVINSYDALRKHLEAQISRAQETRARYRKRFWQVPAALCVMAAVAKVSYTLTKLAFKGN